MEKALIIGGAGFVGSYLAKQIEYENKFIPVVTKLPNESLDLGNIEVLNLNILNIEEIKRLLNQIRPMAIFHLAAQSSVALSWENPGLTVDINIKGSLNLLDAIRSLDYKPRILMIGSGEEYGFVLPESVPIKEDTALHPGNIYAATKSTQNMISYIYFKGYDMDIMSVRAFNHIGPGQLENFVISNFCKQVSDIEKGKQEPKIVTGNIEARREFTDVRDVVRAYTALIDRGTAGETYNVGTGDARKISEFLNIIISKSKVNVDTAVDVKRLRPADVPIIEADISKINKETGWKPQISIEQSIEDILEYWRNAG